MQGQEQGLVEGDEEVLVGGGVNRIGTVYWSPFPDPKKTVGEVCTGPSCYRDAVLCPEHAKALDGLLKDIGQALRGPPVGSA